MKKILILGVLFSFSINGCVIINKSTTQSQKKYCFNKDKDDTINDKSIRTYVVEYDFKTGKFPNGKIIKPRVDVPLVFKINNINRLAYSVKITAKDSVVGYSDLSELKLLLNKNAAEEIAKIISNTEKSISIQNNVLPFTSSDFLVDNINTKSNKFIEMVNDINQLNVNLLVELNSKINEILAGNENLTTGFNTENLKPTKSLEIFNYHFSTQIDLAEIYIHILEKHQTLITLWNDYLKARTIINNPLLQQVELTKNIETINAAFNRFNENKNILNEINLLVNRFQNQYLVFKSNPEITKNTNYGGSLKLFSIVENLNLDVKSIQQKTDAAKFETIRNNIEQIHKLLVLNEDKASLFEFVSDPIQPYQDVAIFKVKVDKKDKDESLFYNERNFSYKIFTRYGVRFDISIGVAGSIYNKENQFDIKIDSLDKRRITKLNKSGFSPTFVGFFTATRRSATHWAYGLSTGLGFNAENGTIALDNFFIGPSLVMGRYERINLTSGVSLKNLRKLDSAYKEGQVVANGTTIETITTKSYEPGFFIALTYNLTKNVKNNLKQLKN